MFINTLPMRTSLPDDPRFTDHLRRVRADCLDAYGHQELPFDQLVQNLDIDRDVSRSPVFQVLFALQNYHGSGPAPTGTAMTGTVMTGFGFETSVTRFDLAMYITETPDGLAGNLTYSTALFDAATVERMAGCFTALVSSISADPEARISTLNLLTPDVRESLIGPSAGARPPAVPHRLLHEVVDCSDPARPAVVAGDSTLSYGDLERRSNQLAGLLRARGVGPDDRVAILLEPSVEAAVAILGVLKAGAAYLPLDPEHPADRLGYIVRDAGVSVAVTDAALRGALPADVPALCMGTDIPADADDAPIESGARPENPRLRHLHLWDHRASQGGDGAASPSPDLPGRHPRTARRRRGRGLRPAAVARFRLRHHDLLPLPAHRRHAAPRSHRGARRRNSPS